MSIEMSYGGYILRPAPAISIEKIFDKNGAGTDIGTIFNIRLNGNIVNTGSVASLPLLLSGVRDIRDAFDRGGKLYEIKCDDATIFECYPIIVDSISFTEGPNNWTTSVPYSITLQCNLEPVDQEIVGSGENLNLHPPFIKTFSNEWSFEFQQDNSVFSITTASGVDSNLPIVRATHNVSAQGKQQFQGPGLTGTLIKQPWEWAREFVSGQLNISPINPLSSGLFNLTTTGMNVYDHFRTQNINEADGIFSVTETFVISKNNGVIENFDVEIRGGAQEPLTTVTIQGNILGLETRNYSGTSVTNTRFERASGYFEGIRDGKLIYPRAQTLVQSENITLNTEPLVRVIGKSPVQGTITYSYQYDTRPSNCITGSKVESISINDENPTDVFSRIVVMGRAQGPIFQSFNTVTDFRRNVTFDVIMEPNTGCSINALTGGNNPNNQVTSILCGFENDLRSRYDKVYKEQDTNFWEPKTGRYSRSVSWAAVDCTNVPPISLCSGA